VVVNCKIDERAPMPWARRSARGEALVCRADVTSHGEAKGLVDETLRAFGRIDVLVNTVGNFAWKPVAEMEPADWRTMLASNLDSVYNMCRLALPSMRQQHWGRIVNFGSVGAERTLAHQKVAAYSAAKAGVVAFPKALALEEARSGITVNVVSPGVLGDGESLPESRSSATASPPVVWALQKT
jgi:3-oxoacyl-[acyl-carrier protein] reductase